MGLLDNTRGPSYPKILEAFQITTAMGSWIFTIASIAGLFVNLSAKWWLGYINPIRGIEISLIFLGAGALFTGLSPNLPFPLISLYLSSFLLGIGISSCGVVMNILIAQGSSEKYRRQAFAGLHSTYGIASFFAPFLLYLSSLFILKWNQHFMVISLVPFIFLFITIFMAKDEKKKNRAKRQKLIAPINLKHRVVFGIMFGCYVASEIIVSSRLVIYIQNSQKLPQESGSQMLSLFFFLLMLGRLSFAFIPIKTKSHRLLSISLISTIIFFLAGVFIHHWILPLTGITMSFFFPVGMSWLGEQFKTGLEFMTATVMTSIGITLIIVHFLFGIISSHFGIETAFWLVPTCSIISLISLLIIKSQSFQEKIH